MQIELTEESLRVVEKWLADGRFQSPDEAVEFALVFYDACEPTIDNLREKIQEGLDDIAAGRVSPLDIEDVNRRGRERLAARKKAEIDG